MTPTYQLKVWQEDDWWLTRVVAASEGSDPAPLNALTQARSLARIEHMGRDLIATILDADEGGFGVEFDYILPGDDGDVVSQARCARAWVEAAQDLWQERAAAAARFLADKGYSLRETAALLGLSHQRIDQLLGGHADHEQSTVLVFQHKCSAGASGWHAPEAVAAADIDALLVVRPSLAADGARTTVNGSEIEARFRAWIEEFALELASRGSPHSGVPDVQAGSR